MHINIDLGQSSVGSETQDIIVGIKILHRVYVVLILMQARTSVI